MNTLDLNKEERIVFEGLRKAAAIAGNNIEKITLETIATEYLGLHRTQESLKKAYDTVKQLSDKGYLEADFGWDEITNVNAFVRPDHQRSRSLGKSEQSFALIMKGGSVKGLAYVGALKELEKFYCFDWFVGTSAGAIAAVLLGAGFTSSELETILYQKDFRDFRDARFFRWPWNLLHDKGIFPGDTLTTWIDDLLARKLSSPSRITLGDLPNRVTVYASRRDDDTFVFDSRDPKHAGTSAAFAVRCSMAIPYIFRPPQIEDMRVLDGGMRNNYPVEALLKDNPEIKFVGLYLGPRTYEGDAGKDRKGSLIRDLLAIWSESTDWKAVKKYRDQTIIIDCRPITTLKFKLSDQEKAFLVLAGRAAALEYLATHLQKGERAIDKSEVDDARTEVEQKRRLLSSSRHWWRKK